MHVQLISVHVCVVIKLQSCYIVTVMSIMSVTGKIFFHWSNSIPDLKIFDSLIGWMLANAGDAT